MLGSHKRLLTIVLTVVTLLVMVAPAAIAAPEWLHGITITSPNPPTAPAYENADGDKKIPVKFDLSIVGTQVCDVRVEFTVLDARGVVVDAYDGDGQGDIQWVRYTYDTLPAGTVSKTFNLDIRSLSVDGWYDIEVEAFEVGNPIFPDQEKCSDDLVWEDSVAGAFLLDRHPPDAWLVKPGDEEEDGATWVTGKDFLLVGQAEDDWDVKGGWFELCPEGDWACLGQWKGDPTKSSKWIPIGKVPADKTPGMEDPEQWTTMWDSTAVPDGYYVVRFCAEDMAGNGNCADSRVDLPYFDPEREGYHNNPYPDAQWIYVNNRYEIDLQAGWNLISTPLLPYDTKIENVLSHLHDDTGKSLVEAVWTMTWQAGKPVWTHWTPTAGPTDTLTNIVDGQGYWIKMKANAELTIVGTWTTLGNAMPPEYPVAYGWNLIGYTHWGRPTIWKTDKVSDYLGAGLIDNLQALFYYDPWTNVWKKLYPPQNMVLGKGYWLSVDQAGVIRF